jgi:L-rhamnose isomerase
MKITISELDDIIERLINHDKYTGYTINENKQGPDDSSLPYILKEIEIRKLILLSKKIFEKQPILLELVPPISILGDIHG